MAVTLKDLNVECYRGIENLELNDFNHVNVFMGDNNSGKTSVMEMICALCAPLDLGVWNEIAGKRSDSSRGVRYFSAYQNIFPVDHGKKIEFTGGFSTEEERAVIMKVDTYRTSISEREANRINGFIKTGNQSKGEDAYIDTDVMELTIFNNDDKLEFEIYDFQKKPPRQIVNYNSKGRYNAVFIEPRDGLENDFNYMKNVIINGEYYDQLISILKEFDAAITGIQAVEERGNTVYYVRTDDHLNAVPISVYGDGLKKALYMFAAMVACKDGMLLIDEVETSIHTSAMNKVFSTLINWARRLNVQLFVSTHSKEALNTMLQCDSEYLDGINVYTLYRNEHKNYVRKLNCQEALDLQYKQGLEIR